MQILFGSHWQHIEAIIKSYQGKLPLKDFLKKYFIQHKNCGSKDRKIISDACFAFYRVDKVLKQYSWKEKILLGFFLLNKQNYQNHVGFDFVKDNWNKSFYEKIALIFNTTPDVFFKDFVFYHSLISPLIDFEKYAQSFFQPLDFFIRIIKNKKHIFLILEENNIPIEEIEPDILKLSTSQKIEEILKQFKDSFFVQDVSCQQLLDHLFLKGTEKIWDCCSGSGGKTILLKTQYPKLKIWNSDKRDNTLINLKQRFRQYGINSEKIFIYDLEKKTNYILKEVDMILADVPCSGSGTWAHTPENKYFFNVSHLEQYVHKQKKIIEKIASELSHNQTLIYITCSVFKAENEEQTAYFANQFKLQISHQTYISNFNYNADTIFLSIMKPMMP